jgi:probable rRNA maturation factor
VSPKKISELNKKYRHKDSPTDILSFSNYEDQKELLEEKGSKLFLGDLIICPEDIENYAKKENISVETELMEVFSHGVLHLLGFSHGDLMFGIQEEVAKNQK